MERHGNEPKHHTLRNLMLVFTTVEAYGSSTKTQPQVRLISSPPISRGASVGVQGAAAVTNSSGGNISLRSVSQLFYIL